jgi:hypothetical protein
MAKKVSRAIACEADIPVELEFTCLHDNPDQLPTGHRIPNEIEIVTSDLKHATTSDPIQDQ